MSHTILLIQPGERPETRTFSDYESVNDCMEGVCKIYEEHLRRLNPDTPTITYDIKQLFDFVDRLADLSCLVELIAQHFNVWSPEWGMAQGDGIREDSNFALSDRLKYRKFANFYAKWNCPDYIIYQKSTNTYAPYNKDWIKDKILMLLRGQASGTQMH